MDDDLTLAAEERRRMIADGVLNPDGSERHTCPWCCDSYDFVLRGAGMSCEGARGELKQRSRLWRWLHPRRTAYLRGLWDAYASVLDDAGK
jgi:hypothetical protein